MPEGYSFRQVDEKHVTGEVTYMLWSPKMDLIAVANIQGEVLLYRLTWQKVWTLPAPGEEVKVAALAWRPDGKVLATGYTTGQITLCDVENSEQLHALQMTSAVTCLSWSSERPVPTGASDTVTGSDGPSEGEHGQSKDCFIDMSAHYLPRLPQFSKTYTALSKAGMEEKNEDAKRLKDQKHLNILSVGTEGGHICLFAYGIFPVASLDLRNHGTGKSGRVLSCHLSHDLFLLSSLVEVSRDDDVTKDVFLISFDTTLLATRYRELRIMALKFGQVVTLMAYLDSTVQQMIESWEDILLEIDSKLMKLAEEKYKACGGSVSNDFLRLLMLGMPSEELQNFLLMELTEKGLKKLGHSIDASYSNIQKLVLKHLQSVGQSIVYHLADIHGMSLWYNKFGVLGLSPQTVHAAVQTAGSLMLKASELQQVIDGSMRNFKAFFRWLYVVIQRLSDEAVSPELSKMTQQDLNFVAQFLKENFTEEVGESRKKGFKLEKVGQYLREEPLQEPPDIDGNPWVQFLKENPQIQQSSLLYPPHHDKSLIQIHSMLKSSIEKCLHKCANVIGQSLECVTSSLLCTVKTEPDKTFSSRWSQYSKTSNGGTHLYTVFTSEPLPASKCHMMRQRTTGSRVLEGVGLEFGEIGSGDQDVSNASNRCLHHSIVDISFYDDTTFCALLHESSSEDEGCPILAQVPLPWLDGGGGGTDDQRITADGNGHFVKVDDQTDSVVNLHYIETVDAGSHIDSYGYRRLENMRASEFSVSGARRVACVLFATRRRVRLFMMDAEDEEEDDEDEDEEDGDTTRETEARGIGSDMEASMEEGDDDDKENTQVSL